MESSSSSTSEVFPPEFFRREDEGDDGLFYAEPRLVVHIDEHAIAALGEYFARVLPQNGVILDLMSSWRSPSSSCRRVWPTERPAFTMP